jgi:fructan beta-fructosidase
VAASTAIAMLAVAAVATLALVFVVRSPDGPPGHRGDDPYRPAVHFTAEQNWINDPNGPVYLDGRFHLFYQYNPDGTQWGNIGWGHAVSDDQITWDELPMALRATDTSMAFSGSAVHDRDDTSGLCGPDAERCLVAIYTGHGVDPASELVRQDQRIAVSRDGGDTWEPYGGNPVLESPLPDFRDPNVAWHEPSESWIMAVALPIERQIHFYRSADLREWEFMSEFGPAGVTEGIWECPVLMELPVDGDPTETRWILKVDHNPGHVTGGSGAQYFVGEFDGVSFTIASDVDHSSPRWVDFGPDFYCAMQWSHEPTDALEGRTWVAWMSNWEYATDTPGHGWRGAMSLPRIVSLANFDDGIALAQVPVTGLELYRSDHRRFAADDVATLAELIESTHVTGTVMDLDLRAELGDAHVVGLVVRSGTDTGISIRYSAPDQMLRIDRSRSGETDFHPSFARHFDAPLSTDHDPLELRVVVDRSSVEVFGPGGRPSVTALVFPEPEAVGVELFVEGGDGGPASLDLWSLDHDS